MLQREKNQNHLVRHCIFEDYYKSTVFLFLLNELYQINFPQIDLYISSLKFLKKTNLLAVGLSSGVMELWDLKTLELM